MTVYQNFQSFRAAFADTKNYSGGGAVTFTAPSTIGIGVGSFLADGFAAAMRIQVVGSASNDGAYTAASVAAAAIVVNEATIVGEGPAAGVGIQGNKLDNSGWEEWPVAFMRASGFDAGLNFLVPADLPWDGFNIDILATPAYAQDATAGVDEFDWHLAQRTDLGAEQYLTAINPPPAGGESFSGMLRLNVTTLAETNFNFTKQANVALTGDLHNILFGGVSIYVREIATEAIQQVNLLQLMLDNF